MADEQKIVFVVDDNNANLIACKNILKPHYTVYPAPSTEKMFELLENIKPDLILMDVEMPNIDGYEAARMLKGNEAYKEIPLIFLSARSDAKSEMEGLSLGALDYIHKPFFSALLLRRIEIHLSLFEYKKTIADLEKTIEEQKELIEEQKEKIEKIIPTINNSEQE